MMGRHRLGAEEGGVKLVGTHTESGESFATPKVTTMCLLITADASWLGLE